MRAEKKLLTNEYVVRLNASPFFIVIGYQGLKVSHFTELRKRLTGVGAEVHVVKNTIFRVAAQEAGMATEQMAFFERPLSEFAASRQSVAR